MGRVEDDAIGSSGEVTTIGIKETVTPLFVMELRVSVVLVPRLIPMPDKHLNKSSRLRLVSRRSGSMEVDQGDLI